MKIEKWIIQTIDGVPLMERTFTTWGEAMRFLHEEVLTSSPNKCFVAKRVYL